jgi:DNA-directed RNA polymerase subunit K/omega
MPVINIYLSQELLEFIKKNKSKIVQQALQEYKEKKLSDKKRCSTDYSA